MEAAEEVLARLTRQAEELDLVLSDASLYAKDPKKAASLGDRRDKMQLKLDEAEAEWLTAAEAYEAALAQA